MVISLPNEQIIQSSGKGLYRHFGFLETGRIKVEEA